MDKESKRTYRVADKRTEAENITTLRLVPVEGERPNFISGQFITVYFPELGTAEGKAYSLSSAPHEEGFTITVKNIGTFSSKLSAMKIGDVLHASGPYGFFYSEEESTPLVLLAGGIGIAPFRSIVSDLLKKEPSRKIALYYSVPTHADAVFLDTFSSLANEHSNFTYAVHVTKGSLEGVHSRQGRISIDKVAHLHKDDMKTEYLMCGSIPFVRDMWKALRNYDIPEERLYTEAFFS